MNKNTHLSLSRAFRAGFHFDIEGAPQPAPANAPAPKPQPVAALRQEFARVHSEAQTLIDTATTAGRELTAEEKTANDQRFSRLNTIKNILDERARFASLAIAQDQGEQTEEQPAPGTVVTPREVPGEREFNASQGKNTPAIADPLAITDAEKPGYARELNNYARTGELGRKARQFATITTTTGSGILLPRQIMPPITPIAANAFRAAHVANGVTPIETSTAANMKIPVLDATAGGVVPENATTLTESGAISEAIDLTVKTYESGSFWMSNLALAANDFDVLSNALPSLQYNKELGLESAIAAGIIADAGITQTVTAATTTGFTYANMVDVANRLPKRYGVQQAIVLSASAYSAMQKLVDSNGRPVLNLDPQNSGVNRFNGIPVFRSDYFEAFGATKVIGCVFSLLGFRIRDVTVSNLARYVNYPGRPNQTGLNLFSYHAYGWAPSAIAKLVTPAS
jgi:HK97 family phage major capsid protein